MKFSKVLAIVCVTLLAIGSFNIGEVYAAGSFSVSGGGTISAGGKGTVTIRASSCAGKFTISASGGGSVSASSVFIDNTSASVSVTAPSSGSTTVTVTASDVTDYDGKSVGGSRSVTFTVKSSTSGSGSSGSSGGSSSSGSSSSSSDSSSGNTSDSDEGEEDEEDSNTNLKSLTASAGVLAPKFSKDVTEYKLYISSSDKECAISASPESATSKVKVSGDTEITEDSKERVVTVTAENGDTKEYTVTYAFIEEDQIIFNGTVFTVIDNYDKSKMPEGLEEIKVTYKDQEIQAYKTFDDKYVLVAVEDGEGNQLLYLYNEEEEVFSLAETVEIEGKIFLVNGQGYMMVYGDNGSGSGYYVYNPETGEMVFVTGETVEETNNKWLYIAIGGVGFLLLVVIILQICIIRKKILAKRKAEEEAFIASLD